MIRKKALLMMGIAGVAALSLSACAENIANTGGDAQEEGDFSTIVDGTLTVGLSPDFPPMEYLDGDQLIGADVDIMNEIASRMGYEVEFVHQKFDQLINSVRTDRVDLVISGMSDTVERQETLEFVDYFASQGRFYTLPESVEDYEEAEDACGASIAVSDKTDYFPALQQFSADVCEGNDLPAVNIVTADSGAAARLQLDQGRADLAIQGAENLAYFEETEPGKYEIVLPVLNEQPFGISVKKGNMDLAEALQETLQSMYDDGTLEDILAEYGVEHGLMEPVINGVTE